MFKSVIYKEWIKTRWFIILLTLIAILAVGNIFLTVQHNMSFKEASNYWYQILFQNSHYFSYLKFVPLIIALALASSQYIPEITDKRIKLTFHLPLRENRILIMMLAYGTASLLISYSLVFLIFLGLSNQFFAAEIVKLAIISVIPWFLAGFAAYFMAGLIILEAIWKYRIAYFIIAAAFLLLFFETGLAGSYEPINLKLTLITLLSSISLLFSAYRFRKGEM